MSTNLHDQILNIIKTNSLKFNPKITYYLGITIDSNLTGYANQLDAISFSIYTEEEKKFAEKYTAIGLNPMIHFLVLKPQTVSPQQLSFSFPE